MKTDLLFTSSPKPETVTRHGDALPGSPGGVARISPTDTGLALRNPGMGWVFHHFDNGLQTYGTDLPLTESLAWYPGLTTAYLRLPWCHVEPEPGVCNWAVVDAAMQRWVAAGLRIALRFSCSEYVEVGFATPEWVREAGARGYFFTPGIGVDPTGKHWEPDYNDPVFLEYLERFLVAAAARYDGDPQVAFIDVGSFGVWGEGHNFWSTKLPYDAGTVIRHLDLHRKHFHRSLLVANHTFTDHGRGPASMTHAAEAGFTLRSDSILVMHGDELYHPEHAELFWRRLPVVLECEHYGLSVGRGVWGDGSGYLQAVEDYHASYASIHWYPGEFFEKNRSLIDRINLRLGYRLQLVAAQWATEFCEQTTVTLEWRNAGVAPCLVGGFVALTLLDEEGGIASVTVDETFDVRDLTVGPAEILPAPTRQTIHLRTHPLLPPGDYTLAVSVGSRTGTPAIALPLKGENQLRYSLGKISVLA